MKRRTLMGMGLVPFVLPAADPISGKWDMSMDTPGGERKATPTFTLDGDKVGGKWDAAEVKGIFKDNKLELEFPLTSSEAGQQAVFKVSAKLDGETLKGNWSWSSYSGSLSGKKVA
jgi:hypothetical protein